MLQYDPDTATRMLRSADPTLGRLMDAVGPFGLPPRPDFSPFQSLMHAVLSQQISRQAADTIKRRVYALFPDSGVPSAEDILCVSDDALRSAGISRSKIATIKNLATKTVDGFLPGLPGLEAMEDGAIVESLTTLRGIGIWTAEMLLIFYLGRPDVLPVTDLGVRRGFKIAFELETIPRPRELAEYGERWQPYRSVASWYLWRANDL